MYFDEQLNRKSRTIILSYRDDTFLICLNYNIHYN